MLDNQKEIFFSLTESGNEIYKAHEKLHKQAEEKWLLLLDGYTKEEQDFYSKVYKGCLRSFGNIIGRKTPFSQVF